MWPDGDHIINSQPVELGIPIWTPAFTQLLWEISHSSCQAVVQFCLARLHGLPGGKMMQTDVAKWVHGAVAERDMLCWWAHHEAFLPFLLCPSRRNQTLSLGNYASSSNMMPHYCSNPIYGSSGCLCTSDLYLAFSNEGGQCDVVERTVRRELRNVASSSGKDIFTQEVLGGDWTFPSYSSFL